MSERAGTSTREESDPPETDDRPRVKRKKREWLNCAGKLDRISGIHHVLIQLINVSECRRLKLRCDRKGES